MIDRIDFEARTKGLVRDLRDFMREVDVWVESSTLEERAWYDKHGKRFKPSTVSRKLRLMAEWGVLKADNERGKSVWYRYNNEGLPKKVEMRVEFR